MTFGILNAHKKNLYIFTINLVCGQNFEHLVEFFKGQLILPETLVMYRSVFLVCINNSLNLAIWLCFIALQSVSYAVSGMQCTAYRVQCAVLSMQ